LENKTFSIGFHAFGQTSVFGLLENLAYRITAHPKKILFFQSLKSGKKSIYNLSDSQ
jgi:hypothetical protein